MTASCEPLRVSEDGRGLVTASGRPFFWLGDTAWELFHRCTIEEAELYLENWRCKGFTVIQAVALAEFDGLHTPNPYGELPLHDDDPTRPNDAYFRDPQQRPGVNHPDRSWRAALDRPGAWHASYLRRLMASRPLLDRIPDQTMLIAAPRGHHEYAVATRDRTGRYAMIYTPIYQPLRVALDALAGDEIRAWWYNPRTAVATEIDAPRARGEQTFESPVDGPDWVLVLDDASQNFPPPGR